MRESKATSEPNVPDPSQKNGERGKWGNGETEMPEEPTKVLTLQIEHDGGSAVMKCQGRLVAGTTEEFHQKVKELLPQTKLVIVDLGDLAYVDRTGLGVLVR